MERTFKVTVDGREYRVTVEEITKLPSTPVSGSIEHVPDRPPSDEAVAISSSPANNHPGDECSPLAGTVAGIDVAVGQNVSEGDRIIIIEAMKMRTQLLAHRAGTVARIDVNVGDTVESGQILLHIS